MKYGPNFQYLFPMRPEHTIRSDHLDYHERQGWVAQYKKNGTCTILAISPTKQITLMNRHEQCHKQWAMTDHIQDRLLKLFPEENWYYFIGEILHAKTKTIKDTLYLFDCMVWDGDYLVKSTFAERSRLMGDRLMSNVEEYSHYVCDNGGKLLYAKQFLKGFWGLFKGIVDTSVDEGLVLKDPHGHLDYCDKDSNNKGWQVKCRHPTKNYQV